MVCVKLLFVPGWAMDASLWQPVLAMLGRDDAAHAAVAEPGYFSSPPAVVLPGRPVIGVGHSLGLMQLLQGPPPGLAGLVSINGFTRFSAAADHPAGVSRRLLGRMRQRLAEDADAAALLFRARCGLDGSLPGPADRDLLREGLELLEAGDCRTIAGSLGIPICALAGGLDEIAPPALTQACFSAPDWVADGGHLLPATHPERCVGAIRALLAFLA